MAQPPGVVGRVSEMAPLVETEYWVTMLPISNVFAPARLTIMEIGALG